MPCIKRLLGMLQWTFGLAPSSIEFVNTYVQNYCRLVSWPPLRFLLLTLGMRAYAESSQLTTDDASCFGVSHLSSNASAADFPFSEPAVLPEICGSRRDCRLHTRIQNYEYKEQREGAYAQDKLNIRANTSSPLFSKISVQKGGTYFRELTVIVVWFNLHYLVDHRNCFFDRVTEVT